MGTRFPFFFQINTPKWFRNPSCSPKLFLQGHFHYSAHPTINLQWTCLPPNSAPFRSSNLAFGINTSPRFDRWPAGGRRSDAVDSTALATLYTMNPVWPAPSYPASSYSHLWRSRSPFSHPQQVLSGLLSPNHDLSPPFQPSPSPSPSPWLSPLLSLLLSLAFPSASASAPPLSAQERPILPSCIGPDERRGNLDTPAERSLRHTADREVARIRHELWDRCHTPAMS